MKLSSSPPTSAAFILVTFILIFSLSPISAGDFFKSSRQVVPSIVKKAARKVSAISNSLRTDDFVAEIRVTSPSPGDFSQDGMQGLSYNSLDKIVGSRLRGVPIKSISIWTSSADSLPVKAPTKIYSPQEHFNEVPMIRKDLNANGLFDEGDSLLFYGHGSSIWQRVKDPIYQLKYQLSHSPWGDFQSYYLGVIGAQGKVGLTLDTLEELGEVNDTLTYLWHYRHAEKETTLRDDVHKDSQGGGIDDSTGVEWHWIYIDNEDRNPYIVSHPNTESFLHYAGDSAYAWMKFYPGRGRGSSAATELSKPEAARFDGVKYNFYINGQEQVMMPYIAYMGKFLNQLSTLKSDSKYFSIQVHPASFSIFDHRFDSYTIAYKAQLFYDERQPYILNHQKFNQSVGIPVGMFLPIIKIVDNEAVGILAFDGGLHRDYATSDSVQYYMWDLKIKSPEILAINPPTSGTINDLNSLESVNTSFKNVEYLIISPQHLSSSVMELAKLRSSSKLLHSYKTGVVEVERIFQHYSGGRPSPTAIRDFLRYVKSIAGDGFKYLLLVGDTHYDVRSLLNKGVDLNVPTYEIEDYATDDFYGLLDPGEELIRSSYDFDLSLGRLPVSSDEDVENYIEKLKLFSEKGEMNQGFWRSQILLAADDFSQNGEADQIGEAHMNNSEAVSSVIKFQNQWINQTKIYIEEYAADASFQKPTAKQDIIRKMDYGQLYFNYFGHGSSDQLSDENLLNDISVNQISNTGKTPIFSAFSCTVGRVDRINGTALAQELMISGTRGAIASIAASRKSYNNDNRVMSQIFAAKLFDFTNDVRVGDALARTKERVVQSTTGSIYKSRWNAEKYFLLGEPVLTLPKPRLEIKFDSIPDTLQALQKVKLKGLVTGKARSGKIYLKVIEQASSRVFKRESQLTIENVPAEISGKTLYAEVLEFQDGKFSTEFITPRKLSFGDTNAVLTAYAWQDLQPYYGSMAKTGISLFGTSAFAGDIDDEQPPTIQAYPCDANPTTTGYYGDVIESSTPACIEFEITDETGIDLSEEVDEGVSVEIEDLYPRQHANFEILHGQRATFRLDLGVSVVPGEYPLEVRALDILGNFSSKKWLLKISDAQTLALNDVYNSPNPMKKGTKFYFKTQAKANVQIKIFDQNGRLVRSLKDVVSGVTVFNGRDRYGRKLANGVYFYKVLSKTFNSQNQAIRESRLEKLLISR